MARSFSAIVALALAASALAVTPIKLSENHFFKGAVTLTTSSKVEKTGALLTEGGFYTATVEEVAAETEGDEPTAVIKMAYGDGVDIPVAHRKEDFDVFAQDPVKKVALVGVKTDGAYTSIEFISSEKTGAVAFPGDATYAVADVKGANLVILDSTFIIALNFTSEFAVVTVDPADTETEGITLLTTTLKGEYTFKADGAHVTEDGKDMLVSYSDACFTEGAEPTKVDVTPTIKKQDELVAIVDKLADLKEVTPLLSTTSESELERDEDSDAVFAAGDLTCPVKYMKTVAGRTVGVCYTAEAAGIYEIAVGGVAGLTGLKQGAPDQGAVIATTAGVPAVLEGTETTSDNEDKPVYVRYTVGAAGLEIVAPEFKTTVTVKETGEPIKKTDAIDCENVIVTKDALFCLKQESVAEKPEGCGENQQAMSYDLTSTSCEPKSMTVCADAIISADYEAVIYANEADGKVQLYRRAHGAEAETLGDAIELDDQTLVGLTLVSHFAEQKVLAMKDTANSLVVVNYGSSFLNKVEDAGVTEISMFKGTVIVKKKGAEEDEVVYVSLEAADDFFKTADATLPEATEKFFSKPDLNELYEVVKMMHDAEQLTLAPTAEYAVSVDGKELTASIRDDVSLMTQTVVNKKIESEVDDEKKVTFVGLKTTAGAEAGFEFAQAKLEFGALAKDSGAKELMLTASTTACYLRITKEVGEGDQKTEEVSYQPCSIGEPAPGPTPGPDPEPDPKPSKLSGGAIAGIVIACVVVVAAAAVLLYFFVFKKK